MKTLLLLFSFFTVHAFAQDSTRSDSAVTTQKVSDPDSLTYQRFLDVVETSLFEYYKETWGKETWQ